MALHDNVNMPPNVRAVGELMALLTMLSRPEGLRDILAKIEPVYQTTVDAYNRLAGEAEIAKTAGAAAAVATGVLADKEAEIDRRQAALDKALLAHEAAAGQTKGEAADVADRAAANAREQERLRVLGATLAEREAAVGGREAAHDKRETELAAAENKLTERLDQLRKAVGAAA